METFTDIKQFVKDPGFLHSRNEASKSFKISEIDPPIRELMQGLAQLEYCFTLQSCFGHFVYENQPDHTKTGPLPLSDKNIPVKYRIAYMAICIRDDRNGRKLFRDMKNLSAIDPDYVQFGCADWFWERRVNSYVIQVEPHRFKQFDTADIDYQEALHVEKVKQEMFNRFSQMVLSRN